MEDKAEMIIIPHLISYVLYLNCVLMVTIALKKNSPPEATDTLHISQAYFRLCVFN